VLQLAVSIVVERQDWCSQNYYWICDESFPEWEEAAIGLEVVHRAVAYWQYYRKTDLYREKPRLVDLLCPESSIRKHYLEEKYERDSMDLAEMVEGYFLVFAGAGAAVFVFVACQHLNWEL
jgi:hypothetical protein